MLPTGPNPAFLLVLALLIAFSPHNSTSLTILYSYCLFPNTTGANYQSNINTLLSSLSSASNQSPTPSFHYAIAGKNTSNAVYGLYLCRGDDAPATCKACVAAASSSLPVTCPSYSGAVIWYDECMIRYSNESFYGHLNDNLYVPITTILNITTGNVTRFNQVLNTTGREVAVAASKGGALEKFATRKAEYGNLQDVYLLGQCTPDLSARDCLRCLQECIDMLPSCCANAQGARVMFFSCNIRYETYSFYGTATPPAPAPQGVSAPPLNRTLGGSRSVGGSGEKKSTSKVVIGIITGSAAAGLMGLAVFICLVKRKKKKKLVQVAGNKPIVFDDFITAEWLLYGLDTLEAATNSFSDDNKIGRGGFGTVYKGTLQNGQEIAVKRLSRRSGQGVQEFKNEILLVAKLQHRNLLRLLGFCLAGDEKLLVYEYVPNKSLDSFLFDPEKQGQLDWPARYKIIVGIARGMLYLHEESQLRVIHRDLKASNVLLDANMKPKISDFGIARIFGGDQTQANTSRVVGTYGYMAPEYAMHGKFSLKSDVYSFGVLVLEIISGKRNSRFYQSGHADNLLSYAWNLWNKGAPLELVDPTLRSSCSSNEVIRCIHLGLLCVQGNVDKRPTMASIVLMLDSYSVALAPPLQPAFFSHSRTSPSFSTDKSTSKSVSSSLNDATISEVGPR